MKVLITGANGFVGKHLVSELNKRGDEVVGLGRETKAAAEIKAVLDDYWTCDLMDKASVNKLRLEDVDGIISLAGLARVSDSFTNPQKYKTINVGVLTNLLEAVASQLLQPRIIAVSTGTLYDPAQVLPLTEGSKIAKDISPYAQSKLLMEQAAEDYRAKGLQIIVVRPFNHIGPGQETGFLVPDLLEKLRRAKSSGVIKAGNLATKRDYTDVRDVVRAYGDLIHSKTLSHNLYNICSGKSVAGQEILDLLVLSLSKRLSNLTSINVRVEMDPSLIRPNEILDIYGSYQRLHAETGWQPQIPLKKTLEDIVTSF